MEIDETLKLIKPGDCVVDLGSTGMEPICGASCRPRERMAVGALNGRIIGLTAADGADRRRGGDSDFRPQVLDHSRLGHKTPAHQRGRTW
jgi:hypothetical protein